MDESQTWEIRAFVYQYFAETAHPPDIAEAASHFALTHEQVIRAYEDLQDRHAVLLVPGTHEIQMAWPFSGVETPFKVRANGRIYFANCAWDSLGIPAALRSDAEIDTVCAQSGEAIEIRVTGQQINKTNVLAHFLVPFRDWYDDLPFT